MFDAIRNYLENDDWKLEILEPGRLIRTQIIGKHATYTCQVKIWLDRSQFAFYTFIPFKVPPHQRPAMCEAIARANYGLILGNFEIDVSDGEVRFKASADAHEASLDPKHISSVVNASWRCADRYLPAFLAVMYGGATPEAAIARIEGGNNVPNAPVAEDEP